MSTCPTNQPRKGILELFRPREPVLNTRDRLIFTALDLFYRRGFHAVGVDQIIADVGVTKTTFYNHFSAKDELVLAAVERRDAIEREVWQREVEARGGGDPRMTLLAYFDVLDDWFNEPAFNGCLFLNATHEFPQPHDPVYQAARTHQRAMQGMMAGWADAAGADDPDAVGEELALLSAGAVTMRQSTGNNAAARLARRTAQLLLERQLPASP